MNTEKTADVTNAGPLVIRRTAHEMRIKLRPRGVTHANIERIYGLLNKYEKRRFITIKDLPFCLMPDATDHFVEAKKRKSPGCRTITACAGCRLERQCPGWDRLIPIDPRLAVTPKDIPREIVFETNSLCNQNCLLCAIKKTKHLRLDLKTFHSLLQEAGRLGIKAVRFTGGEPLLNKDIARILCQAKTNGFYVLLNTAAISISDVQLRLISLSVNNVLISLQGFDQDSNSYLTGQRTDFAQKLRNIVRLRTRIPTLRAGTIISRTLLSNYKAYAALVKKARIDTWELYRPINHALPTEFDIGKDEFTELIRNVLRLRADGLNVVIANPLPFCLWQDLPAAAASMVGAMADDGNSRIVWDVRGYFKPSYFIDKNLGTDIELAWNHPFIKRLRALSYLPRLCKECPYLKWCRGGSRAMAGAVTGDYFRCDPLLACAASAENPSMKRSIPQNQS